MNNNKVYDKVLRNILDSLRSGVCPWSKSWTCSMPRSMATGKEYTGINLLTLMMRGFDDPRWLTYKHATGLGGNVRRGEKGTPCIYFKQLTIEDKQTGKDKRIPFIRSYTLFNFAQCEGIDSDEDVAECCLPIASNVIDNYIDRELITRKHGDPAYIPTTDTVSMPTRQEFNSEGAYLSTYFHELTHSTGADIRLDRGLSTEFGSDKYGKEELIAELGAAFLCGKLGIDNTVESSAAYCAGWLKKIEADPKILVSAASKASKASNYILGSES